MRIIDAPVLDPNARLVDVLPELLRSKCRCGVVASEGHVKGYLSLMNIVRRIVMEWKHGVEPHAAIEMLQVRNIHPHTVPVVHKSVEPEHLLVDMLMHDSDIALVEDNNSYIVNTVLDVAYELRRMLYGLSVSSTVASQAWWAVHPHVSVRDALIHLAMLPTWRLAVVAPDNSVVGVFSATDFFKVLLEGGRPYDMQLQDFLPESTPIVADADQSLVDILYIMRRYNIQMMPVIEGLAGFKGVVLAHDIARLAAIQTLGGRG